ncbi:MAG: DUF2961 domain-containing protein [Candidatus Hydrogenedentes bacterium]|nr:DUF2961 domain-containing protein [Candidatus Hydrogenedentota bacterium]
MKKLLLGLALSLCLALPARAQLLGTPLDGLAQLKAGESMRSSSSDPNWQDGNGDARPIPAGETLTIADLEGPGMITHIWNTIAPGERGYAKLVVVRMYWDGEETPSVEAPLGDFFVIGHGEEAPMESLPVVVSSDGRARNCYWPMPFGTSARITITNEGKAPVAAFFWYVDWTKLESLPENTAYFHAHYRQEYPAVSGRNYKIADIDGRGHYVGTVLNVRQHLESWFGEGDDFFFIDGETEPRLRGTGTEDFFCDAWGFRQFSTPYYGVPVWGNFKPMSNITAYRWHLTDPVNFRESLRVEIEHKGVTFNDDGSVKSGFEERSDDFASVAYWYQTEPHKPFAPMAPPYDRLYIDYSKLFEAESLLDKATATSGPITTQEGGQWGGNLQLWWQPAEAGQTLSLPVTVKEEGPQDLLLVFTHSWDYGIYQPELDGTPLGQPVDLYSQGVTSDEVMLRTPSLSPGEHTLSFRNTGQNEKSTGYLFGLDSILLEKAK